MTKRTITEIVGIIVAELSPLSSEERHRVMQASLTLLGEGAYAPSKPTTFSAPDNSRSDASKLPPRAQLWLQQNELLADQIEQVFHIDGANTEVIAAEIPGKNRSEQSRNAYVLTGIARLLSAGEVVFDDKSARALCERSGCYDNTNHARYLKEKGNEFTGSKDSGWTLTAPGLRRGAAIVKEIAN